MPSKTEQSSTPNSELRTLVGGQFERVRREGRTWASSLVVLNAAPNGENTTRVGFITGKKVGKAVQRNRARRLIREVMRQRLPRIKPGWDLVWIARQGITEADFSAVSRAMDEVLHRGALLAREDTETAEAQARIINKAGAAGNPKAPADDFPSNSGGPNGGL